MKKSIENDLGESALGLALIIKDPAITAVGGVLGFMLAFATGGAAAPVFALVVLWATINDVKHLTRVDALGKLSAAKEPFFIEAAVTQPVVTPVTQPVVTPVTQPVVRPVTQPVVTPKVEARATTKGPATLVESFLSKPYESRVIAGAQRAGKTYPALVVSAKMAEAGTNIFYINLANHGANNVSAWEAIATCVICDLPSADEYEGNVAITNAVELVKEFFRHDDAILIVDEYAYIGTATGSYSRSLGPLLAVLADKIAACSSTGIARKKAIWAIIPEFVAGAMAQDAKAIKKLAITLSAIAPGRTVYWQNNAITFSDELFAQVANNWEISKPPAYSKHERIAYTDGQWLPIGLDGTELDLAKPVDTPPAANESSRFGLPPKHEALMLTGVKSEWLSASEAIAATRALRGMSAADVRALFADLTVNYGLGEVSGQGNALRWRVRPKTKVLNE
jgi:hypothetical protein